MGSQGLPSMGPPKAAPAEKDVSEAEVTKRLTAIATLQDEIEQVYNFERDKASARAQDPEFDKTVGNINTYMADYRKTYRDREYLRDPLPPM